MRSCPILIFLLLIPTLQSQETPKPSAESASRTPYIEREERDFNFYPGGKIEIMAGVNGSVKIVGWQKSTVRIEAEKIVYSLTPEEAQAALKEHPLRVRYTQTSAVIRTPVIPGTVEFNLTIYVPGTRTDIKSTLQVGDFSVEAVEGWIETTVKEGSLEAKSLAGYFSFVTKRGDITIEMSGNRWKGLEFGALTQSGSIDLKFPQKYNAAIQFEARDGKISVDYPPQIVDGEPQPPDIIISKKAQSLKASVGDGGAPIKLATHSGNITLTKIE